MVKRRPYKAVCAAALKTRKDDLQKDRLYDFLTELDDVFDPIRSSLLWIKPVLGIKECFNTIQCEAQ